MESARRSAEGLKITIDADLLPRYLVPPRLAIRENPSYISPARQCRRIDLPLCVLQCNGSRTERCILFIRDVFRQVTKCAATTNFSGNVTRKYTLTSESIREAPCDLKKKERERENCNCKMQR